MGASMMTSTTPRLESARWYVVLVLGLVYAVNIADRYVVATVLEPIRKEFGLSDSGVAWLTGVSLAFFYIFVGLPIARFADRANRRNIVAGAMILWSAATALLGLTQNYLQFLLARIAVGIGEAGGTPPSTSIIADNFPRGRRAYALTIYALGLPLGAWMGSSLAGAIVEHFHSWRAAFIALGVPGVIFGLRVISAGGGPDANVKVPPIASLTLSEAIPIAEQLGLRIKVVERVNSESLPVDTILSQSPEAATLVPTNSVIEVRVVAGSGLAVVPELVGGTEEEATQRLKEANLRLGQVISAWSPTVPSSPID